ncbi:hypothetical protein D3C84_1303030 [compost metagenome]
MLACFPCGAPELLGQFPKRYILERRDGSDAIIVKEYADDLDGGLDELNAALESMEEEYTL